MLGLFLTALTIIMEKEIGISEKVVNIRKGKEKQDDLQTLSKDVF